MKAILIAPFWRRANHLSAVRIERFVRWLKSDGWEIVLVRAGEEDRTFEQPWGLEIAIKDPLGLHPENPETSAQQSIKQYSRTTLLAADLLFNPDPGIFWARRAARHPMVLEKGRGADFVLSSSPPQSAHLCAAGLASRLDSDLLVDMRDGWLDEPLKPLLKTSRLQRIREGRLERRVLNQAKKIFVTSEVWKELLIQRLPFCTSKTVVLTNSYPQRENDNVPTSNRVGDEPLALLYAGQLSLSRSTQKASLLLAPLLKGISSIDRSGQVEFVGNMAPSDLEEINVWEPQFTAVGWRLIVSPPVPRKEIFGKINEADGLLLLCESQAAVPAKLFEYLAAAKPLFVVTPRDSAVDRIGSDLQHFFHIDSKNLEDKESLKTQQFLQFCCDRKAISQVPESYTEQHLSGIFLAHVC